MTLGGNKWKLVDIQDLDVESVRYSMDDTGRKQIENSRLQDLDLESVTIVD